MSGDGTCSRRSPKACRWEKTTGYRQLALPIFSGLSRIGKSASAEEITEIVEIFETAAFDVVSAHAGRVVKLIGDEVMVRR